MCLNPPLVHIPSSSDDCLIRFHQIFYCLFFYIFFNLDQIDWHPTPRGHLYWLGLNLLLYVHEMGFV